MKWSMASEHKTIIYTAEHSLAMGSHGLLRKQNIYEQSLKCLLIISRQGVPENKTSTTFTYVHDLYATVCDFEGKRLPEGVDSKNLSSIISRKEESVS